MDSIAEWCNGNTNDSDSFILGSNPSSAATKTFVRIFRQRFLFLFLFLFSFYSPVSLHTIILKQPRQSGIISMIKQKTAAYRNACAAVSSENKWQTNQTAT